MHKRRRYSNIFDTRVYFGLTEFINLLNYLLRNDGPKPVEP